MDSKVKATAILVVSILCLLLVLFVAALNQKGTTETVQTNAGTMPVENVSGEKSWAELQAFLKDPAFFDTEGSVKESTLESDPTLHMAIASSMLDLRICILDEDGKVVNGENFTVLVEEESYSDLDQDGIILVPDMAPGDYYVSLKPVLGYHMPTEPSLVTVHENLLYEPLVDMKYRVKKGESTEKVSHIVKDDISATEDRSMKTVSGKILGVLLSSEKSDVDFVSLQASGIQFVMIRVCYRDAKDGLVYEDPKYREYLSGAKASGLQVGLYVDGAAKNECAAVEEASSALYLLEQMDIEMPIYYGLSTEDGLSVGERTNVAKAFCQTIVSAGYEAGVYGSKSRLYALQLENLSNYHIWNAEYKETSSLKEKESIWEYTENGSASGISGWVTFLLANK